MKKLLLTLLAMPFLVLSMTANAASSSEKVGVVNLRQVVKQAPELVSISKTLKRKYNGREAKLKNDQKVIEKQIADLKRNASVMTKSKREQQEQKIIVGRNKLQKQQMTLVKDLRASQDKAMQAFLDQVHVIVGQVAKKQKLDMVFQKQAMIYTGDATDITSQVVAELKKQAKKS